MNVTTDWPPRQSTEIHRQFRTRCYGCGANTVRTQSSPVMGSITYRHYRSHPRFAYTTSSVIKGTPSSALTNDRLTLTIFAHLRSGSLAVLEYVIHDSVHSFVADYRLAGVFIIK